MLTLSVLLLASLATALAGTVPFVDTEAFAAWTGRIVGGQTAAQNQFPYQASLRAFGNWHICGASIISNRWLVSAAHCTDQSTPLRVVVGAHHRVIGGTNLALSRVVFHPLYNPFHLNNDISMVQTSSNILFSASVQPISIGSTTEIGGNVPAVTSGWGQTSHNGEAADVLQFLHVRTLTNAACRDHHDPNHAWLVWPNTICSLGAFGNGVCLGDFGGPLVAFNQLIGVISWGISCGVGMPDVHARISSHHTWIVQTMNS